MTDTEARRLAEQHKHLSDFRGSQQDRDLGNLARAYLTRLETPGLAESEQEFIACCEDISESDPTQPFEPEDGKQLLAIIDRLTQPTSTAGAETLRTDTASNADSHVNSVHGGTVAGLTSLPSVGPGAWQDIASAPKDGTLVWLLQRSNNLAIGPHYAYAEFNSETYSHFCLCVRPAPLPVPEPKP